MWAVGGGKGGVGKSFVAANLAVHLADVGKRVVIIDGDLGGANLDAILGCPRPRTTLCDFFARRVAKLSELAAPTGCKGLELIAGDAETLGSANPAHTQKLKLIRHLRGLACDIVVIDLGAGTSFNTLDLFLAADVGLAITSPEPTSVQNCFAFIKSATLRDLERRTKVRRRDAANASLRQLAAQNPEARAILKRTTRLVVNRAQPAEARRVSNLLHDMTTRFLCGRVQLAGTIRDDPAVPSSVRRMTPICRLNPDSRAALDVAGLAEDLAGKAQRSGVRGVNEEFILQGTRLHVQTEDLGAEQAAVRTQVFLVNGSVLYSRRTPYADPFFRQLGAASADRVRFHHVAIRRALERGRIALHRQSA